MKFTRSHEWVSEAGDGTAKVGISDFAQQNLGDIVFVELPEPGTTVTAKDEVALVESVKSASDIYTPVSGVITEVNNDLLDSPDMINSSAEQDGWLFKLKLSDSSELDELIEPEDYRALSD